MALGIAFIMGLLCTFTGGAASNLRIPSKEMLISGYYDYGDTKTMSLWGKNIQYIPESAFVDYSNITVSFCLISSLFTTDFFTQLY